MSDEKPKMPNILNQITINGPNDLPNTEVPNCCTTNKRVMIKSTIGITGIDGFMMRNPSIAETTVMDGVMIPSARSVLPPIIAKIKSQLLFLRSRANSEKMPPSPRLSALRVMSTYLTVVWSVRVQIMQERAPRIRLSLIIDEADRIAFNT